MINKNDVRRGTDGRKKSVGYEYATRQCQRRATEKFYWPKRGLEFACSACAEKVINAGIAFDFKITTHILTNRELLRKTQCQQIVHKVF